MATTINATTGGAGCVVITPDTSGIVQVQSNGVNTNAQAWVNFLGTSGAGTIRASYNVSSITYNGTAGDFTINFTNAFVDANYAVVGSASATGASQIAFMPFTSGFAPVAPSASAFRMLTGSYTSGLSPTYICIAVFR